MSHKFRALFLAATLVLLPWLGALQADNKPEDQQKNMEAFLLKLKLSDTQKEELKVTMARQKEENEKIRERQRELYKELHSLRDQDPINEARMYAVGRELGELKIKAGLQHKKFMDGMKLHLNEEQLTKLSELQNNLRSSMRDEIKEKWRQRQEQRERERSKAPNAKGPEPGSDKPAHPEKKGEKEFKDPGNQSPEEWRIKKQRMQERFNELKQKREAEKKEGKDAPAEL